MRKLALITGGTSGLGLACARALAPSLDLALVYHSDHENAAAAVAELKGNAGPQARISAYAHDLGELRRLDELLSRVTDEFSSSPSHLIAAAGKLRDGLFLSESAETHIAMLNEHLLSPMVLAHSCLSAMYREKYGRIIFFSSITARRSKKGQANYQAAKAGVEGLAQAMALEVAHRGVTVNCIAPGLIETPMTKALLASWEADGINVRKKIPMGRVGRPADIGQAVAFLCSEEASYITGQTLTIDGGRSLGEV